MTWAVLIAIVVGCGARTDLNLAPEPVPTVDAGRDAGPACALALGEPIEIPTTSAGPPFGAMHPTLPRAAILASADFRVAIDLERRTVVAMETSPSLTVSPLGLVGRTEGYAAIAHCQFDWLDLDARFLASSKPFGNACHVQQLEDGWVTLGRDRPASVLRMDLFPGALPEIVLEDTILGAFGGTHATHVPGVGTIAVAQIVLSLEVVRSVDGRERERGTFGPADGFLLAAPSYDPPGLLTLREVEGEQVIDRFALAPAPLGPERLLSLASLPAGREYGLSAFASTPRFAVVTLADRTIAFMPLDGAAPTILGPIPADGRSLALVLRPGTIEGGVVYQRLLVGGVSIVFVPFVCE